MASQICHQGLCPSLGGTNSRKMQMGRALWTRLVSARHGTNPGPSFVPALPTLDALSRACPWLPFLWTTLSKLLNASCLLAQALGPLFERLVTVVRPFVPAFLCLPTLCLGEWESKHVCCVNTSWSRGDEALSASCPGALGSAPPWVVGVGGQADSSPPMTHPFTHGTAGPRLGRYGEPARAALGREQD